MRRFALFSLLGLLVLGSSYASAASLQVDAGVLQAWTFDVDLLDCDEHPDAPDCDVGRDIELTFEVQRYAGESGNLKHTETIGPYLIPAGATYDVQWSGHERSCSAAPPEPSGTGSFLAGDTDLLHTLCVQTGQPADLTVTLEDGTTVEPSNAGAWRISSTSEDLCEGFEDAPFCRGPSDPDER